MLFTGYCSLFTALPAFASDGADEFVEVFVAVIDGEFLPRRDGARGVDEDAPAARARFAVGRAGMVYEPPLVSLLARVYGPRIVDLEEVAGRKRVGVRSGNAFPRIFDDEFPLQESPRGEKPAPEAGARTNGVRFRGHGEKSLPSGDTSREGGEASVSRYTFGMGDAASLVLIADGAFFLALAASAVFGAIFGYVWFCGERRTVALAGISIYAIGCILILLFALSTTGIGV